MTDNDFADPWGLPSTADDLEDGVAPSAPPVEPAAPAEPEPAAEPEVADNPIDAPEAPSDPEAVDDEEDAESSTDAAPTDERSGPYSQVLAAASGLFGRSTTPVPPEQTEQTEQTDALTPIDVADEPAVDTTAVDDAAFEEVTETADLVVDVDLAGTSSAFDQATEVADVDDAIDVEEAIESLAVGDVEIATDELDDIADAIPDTVSVEEIAALASELEVETPEPDHLADPDATAPVEEIVADAPAGFTDALTDLSDITLDMDSAPAVFDELASDATEPEEEDVSGGFDVGAIFHSEEEQQAQAEASVDDAVQELGAEVPEPDSNVDLGTESGDDEATDVATPADEFAEDIAAFGAPSVGSLADDASSAGPESVEAAAALAPSGSDLGDDSAPEDVPSIDEDDETTGTGFQIADDVDEPLSTDEPEGVSAPASTRVVDSGEVEWGARWHESAQGWVEDSTGQATWRPIVTTASALSEWEVDTYLGIVVGDVPVSAGAGLEAAMSTARHHAIRTMVDEALSRGAHAVIGVTLHAGEVSSIPLMTATGTAVTLKPGDV